MICKLYTIKDRYYDFLCTYKKNNITFGWHIKLGDKFLLRKMWQIDESTDKSIFNLKTNSYYTSYYNSGTGEII